MKLDPTEQKIADALDKTPHAPSDRQIKLARIRVVYHVGTLVISLPAAYAMTHGSPGGLRWAVALGSFAAYVIGYSWREIQYDRYQNWALSHLNNVKGFGSIFKGVVKQVRRDGGISLLFTMAYLGVMFHELDWTLVRDSLLLTGSSLVMALPINMFLSRIREDNLASAEEVSVVRLNLTFQNRLIDFARASSQFRDVGYVVGMITPVITGVLYLAERNMSEASREKIADTIRTGLTSAMRVSKLGAISQKVGKLFEPGALRRLRDGERCISVITGRPMFEPEPATN